MGDRRKNKSSNIRTAEKGPPGVSVPEGLLCLSKAILSLACHRG